MNRFIDRLASFADRILSRLEEFHKESRAHPRTMREKWGAFVNICRSFPVSVPAFLALEFIVFELAFQSWITDSLQLKALLVPMLAALTLGCFLGLLVQLIPNRKAVRWTVFILSFLMAALYLTEYFVHDAYHMFMAPMMMLRGAKGVATDYADIVASLLLRESWRILLMLLPGILFLLLAQPKTVNRSAMLRTLRNTANSVLAVIAAGALVFGSVEPMKLNHDFEGGLRNLGVPYAVGQSLGADLLGVEEKLDFVVPDPGYTMQTAQPAPAKPAGEENVPEETEPVVYEPNILPIDFQALANRHSNEEINGFIAASSPTMKNAYTGLFEGKNMILITAEAFTKEVIDPELTPTLYRLANEGICFTDYYQPAWGGSTTGGEMSNVFGIMPDCSGGMYQMSSQKPFITIGSQLQSRGYWSAAYHNNTGTFYDRNTTHTYLGYDRFITPDEGMQIKSCWPQSDLEMMQATVSQYINNQPFSIYYMTVSGHSVYEYSSNAMSRKNYDKVADLPYSEPVKCYLAANLELEYALEYLVDQLEQAGIADDTVIAISPDHYPYGLDASHTWGNKQNAVAELFGISDDEYNNFTRDHSALILWSGCLEDMDITVDAPTFSLDLLPTLCNLFGVEYESRLFSGRDVLSDGMPLVFWPGGSWITERGRYETATQTYTPNEGYTEDPEYVKYVTALVKSKINFAYAVQRNGYIRTLGKMLEEMNNPAES